MPTHTTRMGMRKLARPLRKGVWATAMKIPAAMRPNAAAPSRHEAHEAPEDAEPHPALEQLETIDPNELTPRQALDALFALKALLK